MAGRGCSFPVNRAERHTANRRILLADPLLYDMEVLPDICLGSDGFGKMRQDTIRFATNGGCFTGFGKYDRRWQDSTWLYRDVGSLARFDERPPTIWQEMPGLARFGANSRCRNDFTIFGNIWKLLAIWPDFPYNEKRSASLGILRMIPPTSDMPWQDLQRLGKIGRPY